jgi:hypothetical protein
VPRAQARERPPSGYLVPFAAPNELFELISNQTAQRCTLGGRKDPRLAEQTGIHGQRNIGLGAHTQASVDDMKQCKHRIM